MDSKPDIVISDPAAGAPTVRWGIVATGMISDWFVTDILKPNWPGKSANHIVQAIGSSSLEKCQKFMEQSVNPAKPAVQPTLYGTYQGVYDDPDVDCVYVGTPHSFHKQGCLDAIEAGKNVLCEKPFTMNVKEAEEVFEAAEKKGVFVMEAMWTRFYPLMQTLRKLLHETKELGTIYRTFCDFGMDVDIASLPDGSRYKEISLGAGSLLDIGIYSLTWGLTTLSDGQGEEAEDPEVVSSQTLEHGGVDTISNVLLHYRGTGRQAVCTSTFNYPGRSDFARIEGSKGHIVVHGETPSSPEGFVLHPKGGGMEEQYTFEKPGRGFFWEADAVAHDLKAGRRQNDTMPWAETMRVMRVMDHVRKSSGARFVGVDDCELGKKQLTMSTTTTATTLVPSKPNIGVYTNPAHDLWVAEAQPTKEEVEKGESLKPGEVTVAIKSTGICGSDVHFWHEGCIGPMIVEDTHVLGHES
ncbi:hypothetical protein KC352_g5515, partial [Hortaea werneckii]